MSAGKRRKSMFIAIIAAIIVCGMVLSVYGRDEVGFEQGRGGFIVPEGVWHSFGSWLFHWGCWGAFIAFLFYGASERVSCSASRQGGRGALTVLVVVGLVAIVAVGLASLHRNPAGPILRPGATIGARTYEPLWGVGNWPVLIEILNFVIFVLICGTLCTLSLRQRRWHPSLLAMLAFTLMCCQDPYQMWVTYAAYNPSLLHLPETWSWTSVSVTVVPLIIFLGYGYYYLAPTYPAFFLYRRVISPRYNSKAFVNRHPLVTIAIVAWVVGNLWDILIEVFLMRAGTYIYTHVPGWFSLWPGSTWQLPLMSPLLASVPMAAAAVMLWRDDTGKTTAERIVARWERWQGRPVLGAFLIMFLIFNASNLFFGLCFWAVRLTHSAQTVAQPYPYLDTMVYDPHGDYEKAGEPGPFSAGKWAGWMSGQPSGRPSLTEKDSYIHHRATEGTEKDGL